MRNATILSLPALLIACGPTVAEIAVDPPNSTITKKGEQVLFKALPKDKEGNVVAAALTQVVWSSSNPTIASVDNGKVSALKSGQATINAAIGDQKGTAQLTVSIPTQITIEPANPELLGIGKIVKLSAKVTDEAGQPVPNAQVTWTSNAGQVAMVEGGSVKSLAAGTAVLTATLDELKAETTVTVKWPEVGSVAVDPPSQNLPLGASATLTPKILDAQNNAVTGLPVTWTSSDQRVATVSPEGKITALKRGKTKITVVAGGKSADAAITVK